MPSNSKINGVVVGCKPSCTVGTSPVAAALVDRNGYQQTEFAAAAATVVGVKAGTLAAAGNVDIDLYDGSLLQLDNATPCPLRHLSFVQVMLTSAVGTLRVGGGSNPHTLWLGGTTPTADVEPGGVPFVQGSGTPKAVDATHRIVRLTNPSGDSADYKLIAFGTTT